jgi:hypothetical protein
MEIEARTNREDKEVVDEGMGRKDNDKKGSKDKWL